MKLQRKSQELDTAIAKVIGWRHATRELARNELDKIVGRSLEGWWDGDEYVAYNTPCFSSNINDAFLAAEKANLFGDGMCLLKKRTGEWCVHDECKRIGSAPTPALAICAAILKLKETQ